VDRLLYDISLRGSLQNFAEHLIQYRLLLACLVCDYILAIPASTLLVPPVLAPNNLIQCGLCINNSDVSRAL
jgi:hypothetical protein